MPRTRENTAYAQRLIKEYNHTRKILHAYLKKRHEPSDVTETIAAVIENLTAKQSKIIGYTLNTAYKEGGKEGDKIISKARITAASATVGFDMSKVADTHLNKITGDTIGSIGKYNTALKNQLFLEHKALLADNKLVNSLAKSGWSPSIEKSLVKRGTSAEVISLLKGQTTTKKIVSLLETQGIRGGMHPREVSRLLQPHVTNYFGPKGVIIDNVGKFKKVLKVDADGNYKYVKQAITRPYHATPKSYSNLLARSSMISAHNEGRYQSLQKTGLVDHYISKSILDANTCNICATMHGQRVSHSEGPLYHPSGHCELKPIWKEDSGISNKDPSFYENQRDQHFWKQHQLAEYNKGMPRGAKLKFHSMLPKDALTDMPGKAAMRTIRYNALGKPGGIKPKVSVQKHKAIQKPKAIATMNDKEIANTLWVATAKDGKEHAIIRNGLPKTFGGTKHRVDFKSSDIPNVHYGLYHTHPEWDSPLSENDIAHILQQKNNQIMMAASKENIYVLSRTKETPVFGGKYLNRVQRHLEDYQESMFTDLSVGFKPGAKGMTKKETWRLSFIKMNEKAAKDYHMKYEIIKR